MQSLTNKHLLVLLAVCSSIISVLLLVALLVRKEPANTAEIAELRQELKNVRIELDAQRTQFEQKLLSIGERPGPVLEEQHQQLATQHQALLVKLDGLIQALQDMAKPKPSTPSPTNGSGGVGGTSGNSGGASETGTGQVPAAPTPGPSNVQAPQQPASGFQPPN